MLSISWVHRSCSDTATCVFSFHNMSKRKRPDEDNCTGGSSSSGGDGGATSSSSSSNPLMSELQNLFLTNRLTGTEAQRLAAGALASGVVAARPMARAGNMGKFKGNICRELRKMLVRSSKWAPLYYASVPVLGKDRKETVANLAFHLPHEWLPLLLQHCKKEAFCASATNMPHLLDHAARVCAKLGLGDVSNISLLAFHGDGVPFGSRTFSDDSLEVFTMHLPAVAGGPRVPFTAIQKQFVVKDKTFAAILNILRWSLTQLVLGRMPMHRHDGAAWGNEDRQRRLQAGQEIGRAVLVEIRGDWMFYKQTLGLSGWSGGSEQRICWFCDCRLRELRFVDSGASWRRRRLSAAEFHATSLNACPLWSTPGVDCSVVMPDWLHSSDLGVAADICANVLMELIDAAVGPNKESRLSAVWEAIEAEYARQNVKERFAPLQFKDFAAPNKSFKLKGKAITVRYFVPVLAAVTQERLHNSGLRLQAVNCCMQSLARAYAALQARPFVAADLELASRHTALQWVALEQLAVEADAGTMRWRIKPKLHLWLELCGHIAGSRGVPSAYWTYDDESFGAYLRQLSTFLGGHNTPKRTSYNMLVRWMASFKLPDL